MASSTSVISSAVKDILPLNLDVVPLKLRFADDGSLIVGSDSPRCGADPDQSDTDEDLTSQDIASQSWPAGLGPPPGLAVDAGEVSAAKRTPLRSKAAVYTPLRSHAEAFVPKGLALAGGQRVTASAPGGGADQKATPWTTVMMRNVPLSYTCDSLINLLESKGFSRWFDFVYLPINFTKCLGVGYAFINLITPERAEEFILAFEGFDGWDSSFSKTACAMHWSVCQGLSENINRYRNSPLMSQDVPAFYKPVLLEDGVRVSFPEPTKQLRTLRRRKTKGEEGEE